MGIDSADQRVHGEPAKMDKIPLNYEASEGDTHKQTTATLPQEVVQCLENARFLHLATCSDNTPHVSLMNYTYLPSSPYNAYPVIVMTTNPSSRKTTSIRSNPTVSLLVHRHTLADPLAALPSQNHRRPSPVCCSISIPVRSRASVQP